MFVSMLYCQFEIITHLFLLCIFISIANVHISEHFINWAIVSSKDVWDVPYKNTV
jgi:hypothetical protein